VSLDVRMLTVGPLEENAYLLRPAGGERALLVDPGEEAERLLGVIGELGVPLDAILLTHTHFDHVGAVAAVARATGAPVYVPELERDVLANINDYVRFPGFGPVESYEAEETVAGGERLQLAGLDVDVLFTPGHSPGHVTYSIDGEDALFSGDVLFQGSVGRVDLPGGDWPTLQASIESLLERFDDDTRVHPGHMGLTTLGAERATNPFLTEIRAGR
jgi:glyoxylase-like metal-dependent hydrolase (beta-lactamase superfamily II)